MLYTLEALGDFFNTAVQVRLKRRCGNRFVSWLGACCACSNTLGAKCRQRDLPVFNLGSTQLHTVAHFFFFFFAAGRAGERHALPGERGDAVLHGLRRASGAAQALCRAHGRHHQARLPLACRLNVLASLGAGVLHCPCVLCKFLPSN